MWGHNPHTLNTNPVTEIILVFYH